MSSARYGRPEEEDDREATERARYFVRKDGVRKMVGLAAAYRQMGYSPSGIAKRIGSTTSTVKQYVEAIEDEFGLQAVMPKAEENRTGPLGEGAVSTGTSTEDHESAVAGRDVPDLSDDPRTFPRGFLKRDQWLIRDGKVPKAPWAAGVVDRTPGGDDPGNQQLWESFEAADEYVGKLPTWGLYFVLHPPDPFVGIDLDDCRDPETGDVDDRAREIVEKLEAFTEISPSGTGLHIYIKGSLPPDVDNDTKGVEIYDSRQLTVTGDHLSGTPTEIPERQETLDELVGEYMSESVSGVVDAPTTKEYDDDEEPFSPFDELLVTDIYPELPIGTNAAHPEHDSKTGKNFRISEDGSTAVCWHGQHRVGEGDGCGLSAHHLLAMRATGSDECDRIRERWAEDDELVFETWLHALNDEGGIDLDPSPPPWRAVRHIDSTEQGLGLVDESGESAYLAFRFACRIIREDYDVPVEISDEDGDGEGWS